MSALGSGKAFEDLTDEELAELEAHDWTAEQIIAALAMALRDGATEAAVDLLARLTRKDPRAAAAVLAIIEAS